MKANNYIKQLKEMVNNNVLETIETVAFGVQAYGISANEYEVITKFAKQGGRYYFIDRNGNRYLASRYDRAELVARDILDNLQYASETAQEYVCKLEEKKQIAVDAAHLELFFDFCDLLGFDVESVENHYHDNGEMSTVYRIKGAQDDAQSNDSAADEQQTESEATVTTCEPSRFSRILAKMKNAAKVAAEKMEFVFVLLVAFAVGFLAMFGAVAAITSAVGAMIPCGSIWGVVLSLVLLLSVGFDFIYFAIINVMAILARFFPSEFERGRKPHFILPASFWYAIYKNNL